MDEGRPFEADRREREEPAERFFDALGQGDIDVTLEPCEVNGQPGAIFCARDSKVPFTLTLDVLYLDARRTRQADSGDPLGEQPRRARAPGSRGRRLGGRPRGEPGSPARGFT